MKKNIILVLFLLLIVLSCEYKKNDTKRLDPKLKEFNTSKYFKFERIQKDKYDVKFKGNMKSYSELVLYYSYNNSRKEELLPYTLIMIEKHKKYSLCTDMFNQLIAFYTEKESEFDGSQISFINEYKKLNLLNNEQRNFCLYFIKLGAINNDIASMYFLETLYRDGLGMDKNILKADSINNLLGTNNDKVIIEDLNNVYNKNKNLEFTIVNNSSEFINYYISVDFNDVEWREIVYTIYDHNSKSSLSKIIQPNQKIKVKIPINRLFYEKQLYHKKYRLKISYGNKNLKNVYYSSSFKII